MDLQTEAYPTRGPLPEKRARTVFAALLNERGSLLRVEYDDGDVVRCERRAPLKGKERGRVLGRLAPDAFQVLIDTGLLAVKDERVLALSGHRQVDYVPARGATIGALTDRLRLQEAGDDEPGGSEEQPAEDTPPASVPVEAPSESEPEPLETEASNAAVEITQTITLPPLGGEIPMKDLAGLVGLTSSGIGWNVGRGYLNARWAIEGNRTAGKLIAVDDLLIGWLARRGFGVTHTEAAYAEEKPPAQEPQGEVGVRLEPDGDGFVLTLPPVGEWVELKALVRALEPCGINRDSIRQQARMGRLPYQKGGPGRSALLQVGRGLAAYLAGRGVRVVAGGEPVPTEAEREHENTVTVHEEPAIVHDTVSAEHEEPESVHEEPTGDGAPEDGATPFLGSLNLDHIGLGFDGAEHLAQQLDGHVRILGRTLRAHRIAEIVERVRDTVPAFAPLVERAARDGDAGLVLTADWIAEHVRELLDEALAALAIDERPDTTPDVAGEAPEEESAQGRERSL